LIKIAIKKLLKKIDPKILELLIKIYNSRIKIIIDFNQKLPRGKIVNKKIPYKFYSKEILSRSVVLEKKSYRKLNFLDVGGRDGETYLLNYYKNFEKNLNYEKDKEKFFSIYNYFYIDLCPNLKKESNAVVGDICNEKLLDEHPHFINHFDMIYSNEVFEHLKKPWIACFNINKMLKDNGECITIVPFSQRYHESPVDCFRYSHEGIRYLFENEMQIEIIALGYDIDGRRNDWNGSGIINDYIPEDNFGAWRETWYTILIFKKIKSK
jgi:hypothetical protein